MTQIVIGETPLSQKSEIREELRKLLNEMGSQFGGDFQSLGLMLVHFRNSRLDKDQFISLLWNDSGGCWAFDTIATDCDICIICSLDTFAQKKY